MAEIYIGLMSGTSADGVDAVLASFEHRAATTLEHAHVPFDAALRAQIVALMHSGPDEIERLGTLSVALAQIYAKAVDAVLIAAGMSANSVRAIGAHGQTIRHRPESGFTLQLNHPALLARLTAIDVVADFRSADVAAGGQGAPLVPAFHEDVFASTNEGRAIVNIGGIANVSLVVPGVPTRGWDCGPGNTLLDLWCAKHRGAAYDNDGEWAASGEVSPALLALLKSDPYFAQTGPKSTGRERFNMAWLTHHLAKLSEELSPQNIQRTLLELTAIAIADALHETKPERVLVCGGGARNSTLMRALQSHMKWARVETTLALGCPVDQVEALAFAWLAQRYLLRQAGNSCAVTGAKYLAVLGALYPASVGKAI